MPNFKNYTMADFDRCIELCEELADELMERYNRNRKRLDALNIERTYRKLEADIASDKEKV